MNYYNEIDPKAAAWLRELSRKGLIAEGEVDERSIADVTPNDLQPYIQCHFFAGIGVWSHALRSAGWPDDRPVWTGSCPCQPFSAAGAGAGFADDRHLWPAFHWLISQCRPDVIFGEQVAQKAGAAWFDLVSSNLEGEGYACGQVVFPACGVGAPHQRQRRYWVADTGRDKQGKVQGDAEEVHRAPEKEIQQEQLPLVSSRHGTASELGNADGKHARRVTRASSREEGSPPVRKQRDMLESPGAASRPNPTNGFWADPDWLGCTDGKFRAAEPGTFPLAHGAPARVGRLRGYGNAIVAPQAQAFIEAYCLEELCQITFDESPLPVPES